MGGLAEGLGGVVLQTSTHPVRWERNPPKPAGNDDADEAVESVSESRMAYMERDRPQPSTATLDQVVGVRVPAPRLPAFS